MRAQIRWRQCKKCHACKPKSWAGFNFYVYARLSWIASICLCMYNLRTYARKDKWRVEICLSWELTKRRRYCFVFQQFARAPWRRLFYYNHLHAYGHFDTHITKSYNCMCRVAGMWSVYGGYWSYQTRFIFLFIFFISDGFFSQILDLTKAKVAAP